MTINIGLGWLVIGSTASFFMILPISLLIRKFLLSDYFYNKTGYKTYYVNDNGSRNFIDPVNYSVCLIFLCLLVG